jgi:hypothetical protein
MKRTYFKGQAEKEEDDTDPHDLPNALTDNTHVIHATKEDDDPCPQDLQLTLQKFCDLCDLSYIHCILDPERTLHCCRSLQYTFHGCQ